MRNHRLLRGGFEEQVSAVRCCEGSQSSAVVVPLSVLRWLAARADAGIGVDFWQRLGSSAVSLALRAGSSRGPSGAGKPGCAPFSTQARGGCPQCTESPRRDAGGAAASAVVQLCTVRERFPGALRSAGAAGIPRLPPELSGSSFTVMLLPGMLCHPSNHSAAPAAPSPGGLGLARSPLLGVGQQPGTGSAPRRAPHSQLPAEGPVVYRGRGCGKGRARPKCVCRWGASRQPSWTEAAVLRGVNPLVWLLWLPPVTHWCVGGRKGCAAGCCVPASCAVGTAGTVGSAWWGVPGCAPCQHSRS